tara:strand:- start:119 stop:247 length:129 start_codon:yes stop_codon:yes gene_type:complete
LDLEKIKLKPNKNKNKNLATHPRNSIAGERGVMYEYKLKKCQ